MTLSDRSRLFTLVLLASTGLAFANPTEDLDSKVRKPSCASQFVDTISYATSLTWQPKDVSRIIKIRQSTHLSFDRIDALIQKLFLAKGSYSDKQAKLFARLFVNVDLLEFSVAQILNSITVIELDQQVYAATTTISKTLVHRLNRPRGWVPKRGFEKLVWNAGHVNRLMVLEVLADDWYIDKQRLELGERLKLASVLVDPNLKDTTTADLISRFLSARGPKEVRPFNLRGVSLDSLRRIHEIRQAELDDLNKYEILKSVLRNMLADFSPLSNAEISQLASDLAYSGNSERSTEDILSKFARHP
jgi:hypothetical protein